MSDLVAFLTARLDEDQHGARAADDWDDSLVSSLIAPCDDGETLIDAPGEWVSNGADVVGINVRIYNEGSMTPEQAEHIARHDPARVLRDVEAKRAVVGAYVSAVDAAESCGLSTGRAASSIEGTLSEPATTPANTPGPRLSVS